MKKLNLGCGFDYRPGYVNADNFEECNPDVLMNIEDTPWNFSDNEFDYVLLKHVLEHVGQSYLKFKSIMQELYRATKNNGLIEIHIPYFKHDTYWSDPTHVRAFTLLTFQMMSKAQNDDWIKKKANYSMIAYDMGVNFEVAHAAQVYDNSWIQKELNGEVTREKLREIAAVQWNVVRELQVKLKVIKPFDMD